MKITIMKNSDENITSNENNKSSENITSNENNKSSENITINGIDRVVLK